MVSWNIEWCNDKTEQWAKGSQMQFMDGNRWICVQQRLQWLTWLPTWQMYRSRVPSKMFALNTKILFSMDEIFKNGNQKCLSFSCLFAVFMMVTLLVLLRCTRPFRFFRFVTWFVGVCVVIKSITFLCEENIFWLQIHQRVIDDLLKTCTSRPWLLKTLSVQYLDRFGRFLALMND